MEMKNDLYRVGSSMFGNYRDAAVFAKSRAIRQHDIEAYVPAIGWTTRYQRPNVVIEEVAKQRIDYGNTSTTTTDVHTTPTTADVG